jgi:DNA-directed RNA polymerase subunit RPC12/RpoP
MNNMDLKPVKGIEEWARKRFKGNHFIYYTRKGAYAECHCAECGERYILRATSTEDPFKDMALDIEKPQRDMPTKCRKCKRKAVYKPAGATKSEYDACRICYGQKIDDEHFVFRIFYAVQRTKKGKDTYYGCDEEERIFLEKGKKPSRYDHYMYYTNDAWNHPGTWYPRMTGENWYYLTHPQTQKEIAKTGMFKYVPVVPSIMDHWRENCGLIDYYIAAARYPDFEMIIKAGLTEYADNLVRKIPVNPNPRGKTIADRLRVNKDRVKSLIAHKGAKKTLEIYQLERRYGKHWTEEELGIIEKLRDSTYSSDWEKTAKVLKHISPVRLKNYMKKQRMWMPGEKATWREAHRRSDLRREYYDYISMRINEGYDMTNDVILFPSDFRRRRDEMIQMVEKAKMDKRKKEVLERYPKIKAKYRRLSEKYAAAAGGYIIRPAKDAAEIVEEGRILHHCVGGDGYLSSHNNGRSFILFLRKADKKNTPLITIEIQDEKIIQWYGAYDKKPNRKLIDAWLNAYTQELAQRKTRKVKAEKGAA